MLQWRGGKQSIQLLKENSINSYFTWTKWYHVCHIKHAQKCYYTLQTQSKKYGIRSKKTGRIYTYIQEPCRLLPHFHKELKVNIASTPALSKRLN